MEFDSTFNSDFAIHSYGFKPIEDQRKLPPGGEVETKSGGLLGWVDWLGGILAYGLGISTPKYEYIIQESQRLHRQSDSTEEKDIRLPLKSNLS
ncbi:unnamed protein product [Calicophoron daubneyi]|uniref:Uncharacterized protein n=1 Tax=Calicophoron daubneyi TaxID=300641 RepID=A0AAV2TAR9_CALDB